MCATERCDVIQVRCIHADRVGESKKTSAKTSSADRNHILSMVTSGQMGHWSHFMSMSIVITRHFVEKKISEVAKIDFMARDHTFCCEVNCYCFQCTFSLSNDKNPQNR